MLLRYIRGQLIKSLLFFSVTLISLLWLTQSLRFIEVIINYNVSLSDYFTLVTFLIPDLVSLALPICGALAAVWVYYRLIVHHEFLAMQSLGFSIKKLSRPLIHMGLSIAVFSLVLNILIVPSSFRAFRNLEYDIRGRLSQVFLKPGAFTSVRGLTLYTDNYEEGKGYGLILIDIPGKEPSTLVSESGYYDGRLFLLKKGYRQTRKANGFETLSFQNLVYDVAEFAKPQQTRSIKPYERNLDDLLWPDVHLNKAAAQHFLLEGHQRLLMPALSIIDSLLVVFFFLCKSSTRRRFQKHRLYQVLVSVLLTHVGSYIILNICVKGSMMTLLPYLIIGCFGVFFAVMIQKEL